MIKPVQMAGFSVIFIFLLSACATAPEASYDTAEAPYYDSDITFEQANRGRSGEIEERMIRYSAFVEIAVKDTEETRNTLIEQVKNNKGFIVRENDYSITTRIPSENMNVFINDAKALGKVKRETKTGVDITDQYRDNVLRLESLKSVRDRYVALLQRATTVSEMLSIEKELQRVNTEIEVLEGKIKYAELSVIYSDITIQFKEQVRPGPIGWIFYGLGRAIAWLFVWN